MANRLPTIRPDILFSCFPLLNSDTCKRRTCPEGVQADSQWCPSGALPTISRSRLTIVSLGRRSCETPTEIAKGEDKDYWRSGHWILMQHQSALLQGHQCSSSVHWTPTITICRSPSSSHFEISVMFTWKPFWSEKCRVPVSHTKLIASHLCWTVSTADQCL